MKKSIILTLLVILVSLGNVSAQNKRKYFGDENAQYTTTTNTVAKSYSYFNPQFLPTMSIGWGFVEGDGSAYEATIGANYEFIENFYVGARLGYLGGSYYFSEMGYNIDTDMHFISIPIELGYTIVSEHKFGVVPFVGLGFNVGLSGESEIDDYEMDLEIGGDLGIDGRAGLRIMLGGWTISGTYHFPLNNNQEEFFGEDAYPEVSIGWFLYD